MNRISNRDNFDYIFCLQTPEELWHRMNRHPFSREKIENFLRHNKVKIHIERELPYSGEVMSTGTNSFLIRISAYCNEKLITFVHELIHCVYKATAEDSRRGLTKEGRVIEALIEQEAGHFYKHNENFLEEKFKQLLV